MFEASYKLPISAIMVIYNEEAVLERSLRSFFDLVDEIIIIHDGKCSDRSLNIAEKYTNRIFEIEHFGASEIHRPFAYGKAKNNWILQMDADEYLSDSLRENLRKLIENNIDIYEILWSTCHRNSHHFWHYKRMLFKKDSVYFIGATHESVKPINEKVRIKKSKHALMHEPAYDNISWAVFNKKWKKLANIQAKQLLGDFSTIPKWNCQLTKWEFNRRIRINHPIILGIIGTSIYNIFFFGRDFLRHKKYFLLKQGFFSLAYHFYLYLYLIKLKKDGQKR